MITLYNQNLGNWLNLENDSKSANHLTRIIEFREKIYTLIEEYLNPLNESPIAQGLQKQLNESKINKSKILGNFIYEIFTNPGEYKINFSNPPSMQDKLWTKTLLIYDFLYYGPVTLLMIPNEIELHEDLKTNPLWQYIKDEFSDSVIIEIRINNYKDIFIETNKKILKWNISFVSEESLENIIQRIIYESNLKYNAYTKINSSSPIADFEHPCGFIRGSAIIPPASEKAMLTLRIHPKSAYKLDNLEKFGMLDKSIRNFLIACQQAGTTIAIAGTMGSGKTTLLSALAEYWPANGRKATIEDTPELNPEIDDLIKLRTIELSDKDTNFIDVAKLTKACKRHSVKYVVLSEARDGSAWDILQLSQTILGTLLTFHYTLRSNRHEVDQALNTLVALAKQNPIAPKGEDIKHLIASMVQILILVEQNPIDAKRRINKIYYITGYDELNGGHFKYTELFSFNNDAGYKLINKSEAFEEYLAIKGVKYCFL